MSLDPALIGQTAGGACEETIDAIEDAASEIDEVSSQLTELNAQAETRHADILERLNTCLAKVETLSSSQTAENPLLTQVLNQVVELKAEILSLKASMDSTPNPQPPSELIVTEEIPASDTPSQESPMEDTAKDVENPPVPERRKNRFI